MPSVKTRTLEERFWAKVDGRGPSECWPWKAALNEHGYGVMRPDTTRRNGPTIKAHRVSAQLAGMRIEGMKVLHSCDNPRCVNPAHLRPGTMAENSADMVRRRRNPVDSEKVEAKLTEADVLEIRRRIRIGEMHRLIAADFGVSRVTISDIKQRKSWRHLQDDAVSPAVGALDWGTAAGRVERYVGGGRVNAHHQPSSRARIAAWWASFHTDPYTPEQLALLREAAS